MFRHTRPPKGKDYLFTIRLLIDEIALTQRITNLVQRSRLYLLNTAPNF